MCQRDNNLTKEQTTAEGHQWVFNAARNFHTYLFEMKEVAWSKN